jgi:ppGpp synthetase/RelA/SpoT-type nucleotidyltranferase
MPSSCTRCKMLKFSRTQIDKLGDRLVAQANAADNDMYFELRDAYAPALGEIEQRLRRVLPRWPPVSRLKTLDSVVAKMRRGAARRLSTIQDIAGCRLVLEDILDQDKAVGVITTEFGKVEVDDKRGGHPHGYRAVHVIVDTRLASGIIGQVEIQIRTALQHDWAELSEKLADLHGRGEKYTAEAVDLTFLEQFSDVISELENAERSALIDYTMAQILAETGLRRTPPDPRAVAKIKDLEVATHQILREYLNILWRKQP